MMIRGDLGDLAAFAVIAHKESFTHTATELRLSTSVLSYVIKELEARASAFARCNAKAAACPSPKPTGAPETTCPPAKRGKASC